MSAAIFFGQRQPLAGNEPRRLHLQGGETYIRKRLIYMSSSWLKRPEIWGDIC